MGLLKQYDDNGNLVYGEYTDGRWFKIEYDTKGKRLSFQNSDGDKLTYDDNGNAFYYNSDGNKLTYDEWGNLIRVEIINNPKITKKVW